MLEIYPLKAQYKLGENITLRINSDASVTKASIAIFSLYKKVFTLDINGPFKTKDIKINASKFKNGGYGVSLIAFINNKIQEANTAFDIFKDINKSLRYGFVSDFKDKDINNGSIEWLLKCHINTIQFYDWSYRHDSLVSKDDHYKDMMGKSISKKCVISKIKETKSYGMRSIGYGAVYAASKEFYLKHKDLAFVNPNNSPLTFIDIFYLMNIERKSPWCDHLINEYYKAIKYMGFDGIHMDTYGSPKKALSNLNGKKHIVNLDKEFKYLINKTKVSLNKKGINPILIFNNVSNWPVYATANSLTDAVYVEVWDPYSTYLSIASIIKDTKITLKKSKPIIIAAYLKPFKDEGIKRGMNALKLLMACIVSNGAYHLITGENKAVLTQGYYSDYTKLDDKSANELKSYYDFMIRYSDIFFDDSLKDVSSTHFKGESIEYIASSKNICIDAQDNKIWTIIKENSKRKVISLINLSNNNNIWNKGKAKPTRKTDIEFKVLIQKDIKGVYFASADSNNQKMNKLNYKVEETKNAKYIKFTIPSIDYWSIIDIE